MTEYYELPNRRASSENEPDAPQTHTAEATHQPAPKYYGIILIAALLIGSGLWVASRFAASDLARDIGHWQEKLNLIAESRSESVTQWVNGNFQELQSLADNPSMQLYLTELSSFEPSENEAAVTAEDPAQKVFLRNLLIFSAQRGGFNVAQSTANIPANVQQESGGGLAVLDMNQHLVVSTSMPKTMLDLITSRTRDLQKAEQALLDVQKDAQGKLYIGFAMPIFSIQGERDAASQTGWLVGVKPFDHQVFALLQPTAGIMEKTLEMLLVRQAGNVIEFLSPMMDGSSPLAKQMLLDKKNSAEAILTKTPGSFVAAAPDYREKQPVLATSRAIAGTPWTLLVKLDRTEALAKSNERRTTIITFFIGALVMVALLMMAVWWRAHSLRALMASTHFRKLANKSQAQERMLRLVSDHQPEAIFILDESHHYRFANRQTAERFGMMQGSVLGKNINDVMGAAIAAPIMEQCKQALAKDEIVYNTRHLDAPNENTVIRSVFVPLKHIPDSQLPDQTPGVLVVEQDISEMVKEREARVQMNRQLVQTLLRLVDRRDPFAANHSTLVSQMAREVATEMGLDQVTIDTAYTAGSLMNIGKIVVPAELLTKTSSLSDEEKHTIRDSLFMAAELVREIEFDGPVIDTLKQWQEKWDGSGPLGLRGDAILVAARIVAVVNAFIGMTSPRSWRNAITIDGASKFLLDQSETFFDRKVVVALVNYLENHSGREWLKQSIEDLKEVA